MARTRRPRLVLDAFHDGVQLDLSVTQPNWSHAERISTDRDLSPLFVFSRDGRPSNRMPTALTREQYMRIERACAHDDGDDDQPIESAA